ncbi:ribonuclease III [Alteromonas sp. ASW11-36]|uniref:Ribonuclease 3 n=1 Tax=Alteromonas arenosi TaxID=3055817 RepID=A0ABT7SUC3_9ALTE|nr:ribonuclease III [Alteromonas sp. ASW11-36]MDM7859760.1 ribonuclease III [Alteromonas sp. ASW11-36]
MDINAAARHIKKSFGYQFSNLELLDLALTHRSAAKAHNERLEFLGDAVLGMVVAKTLYTRYPNVPEGKLTRMRASLVKGETLAGVAKDAQLGEWLKLGSGELKSGGKRRASILADVTEALFGAIYLDADVDVCERVILKLLESRIAKLDPNAHPKDFKTQLQEFLQSRKQALPHYEIKDIQGKEHDQTFTVACQCAAASEPTIGVGPSRRRAEQHAAQQMLEIINQRAKS